VWLPPLLSQVMGDQIGNVTVVLGNEDSHVAILCGGLAETEQRQGPVRQRRDYR
jgi:hypothetical protein